MTHLRPVFVKSAEFGCLLSACASRVLTPDIPIRKD